MANCCTALFCGAVVASDVKEQKHKRLDLFYFAIFTVLARLLTFCRSLYFAFSLIDSRIIRYAVLLKAFDGMNHPQVHTQCIVPINPLGNNGSVSNDMLSHWWKYREIYFASPFVACQLCTDEYWTHNTHDIIHSVTGQTEYCFIANI